LQRFGSDLADAPGASPMVVDVLRSAGTPLSRSDMRLMERRFEHDFSRVRVHVDAEAGQSARSVSSRAYTVGQDIVFAPGQFAPGAPTGQRLLAHELAHVVQQDQAGSVASPTVTTPVAVEPQGSPAEREAEQIASSVVAGGQGRATMSPPTDRVYRADVEDCSADDTKEVRAALSASDTKVVATVNAIMGGGSTANAAVAKYFGSSGSSRVSGIALRLLETANGLKGATIECENPDSWFYGHFCGEGTLGYVRAAPAFLGLGSIHLCQPSFHNLTGPQRICTLVHEGAHRYIDADDEAYYTLDCAETSETRGMDDDERYENADSFGCLVQTLG
jgi:hypothetical protein